MRIRSRIRPSRSIEMVEKRGLSVGQGGVPEIGQENTHAGYGWLDPLAIILSFIFFSHEDKKTCIVYVEVLRAQHMEDSYALTQLKWRLSEGWPSDDACSDAARNGHLDVLKWARANGCPWDEWTCAYATRYFHILKWARENGCPWDADTCSWAAGNGHLDVLKWARANGCPWDEWTCAYATRYFHILKWARENGCPWDEWTCAFAAKRGHLETLKWARANGCPWDEWTCRKSAEFGHLETLKWVRANGCPWDSEVCTNAAEGGHLETLKWVRANGCPWDKENCMKRARRNKHTGVVDWIRGF
jgi:hypothetical protein